MEEENDKMETETPKEEEATPTIITVNVKTPKEKKSIKSRRQNSSKFGVISVLNLNLV